MGRRDERSQGSHHEGRHALRIRTAMTEPRAGKEPRLILFAALIAASVAPGACQRERRDLTASEATAQTSSGVVVSGLLPSGVPPTIETTLAESLDNAYAMNEG